MVANPRQVRDFASTGQLAKTDALDAGILALFAERVLPTPRPLPDAAAQLLDAVLTRRRQLLEILTAEKNRLGFAPQPLHRGIQAHIRWLERQLEGVTKELATLIEASLVWRAKDDLLQSVRGVGPIVSSTLLGELPDLSTLSQQADRRPGGRRAAGTRQRDTPGEADDLGRTRQCEDGPLHGSAVRPTLEPGAQSLLRAAHRRGEAEAGGPHRLCPEAPDHPQRHGAEQHLLAVTGGPTSTQLLVYRLFSKLSPHSGGR